MHGSILLRRGCFCFRFSPDCPFFKPVSQSLVAGRSFFGELNGDLAVHRDGPNSWDMEHGLWKWKGDRQRQEGELEGKWQLSGDGIQQGNGPTEREGGCRGEG